MTLASQIKLIHYNQVCRAGQTVLVRCAITNAGAAAWPVVGDHPVRVAYRWRDRRGALVVPDGKRTEFAGEVAPGDTVEVDLIIQPPLAVGEYSVQIDLVAEQRAWFHELGSASLDLPVTIAPLEAQQLRVCIVNTNCIQNDAVGNAVIEQLRFFERQGHVAYVLAEYVDERLPAEIRRAVFTSSFDEIERGLLEAGRSWVAHQFFQADLYIFHYSVYYALAETIRFVQGGSIVFDYHGLTPPQLWGDASGLALLIEGQQKAQLAQYADYAIVHSRYMADELHTHSGFDKARMRIIPYVVPVEQFRPLPRDPELVARYGLEGQQVLLYIGRMAGNKRIDDLVRMLTLVRAARPDTKLLLVGDNRLGVYKRLCDQALSLARELGCAEQVIFTGPVAHAELYRFYNLCDVYVTSSLHEGFCVPVIEAMACGRPVVATDITALPETVGDAGLLFPAEDAAAMAAQVLRLLAPTA